MAFGRRRSFRRRTRARRPSFRRRSRVTRRRATGRPLRIGFRM